MKIKFTSKVGKNDVGAVADVEDVKAKSYIDDALAEAVEASPEEKAVTGMVKSFEGKIEEIVSKATEKHLDNITKSVSNIRVGAPRELEDRTGGFKSLPHFLLEVKKSSSGEVLANPTPLMTKYLQTEALRTKTAGATPDVTTGQPLSLTAGTTDGAIIPVEYIGEIFKMYGPQTDFSSMCFPFPMQSLSAHLPVLRNYDRSNTNTSLGVVVQEAGEGQVISNSKTNWEQKLFTTVTEGIMVPITNEALQTNNVNVVNAVSAQAIYQLNKWINGGILKANQTTSCTGIIGHASTAIAGRATNGTIAFGDVLKMFSTFDHEGASYANAVWVGHPTIIQAIYSSSVGSWPAMIPPGGGIDGITPLTILGRPLYLSGYASALGNTADLMLVDFKQYIFGYRGGVESFVSPHVFATSYQTGFRYTWPVNGQPGRTGLVTLEDGQTKVSSAVVLGQVGGLS